MVKEVIKTDFVRKYEKIYFDDISDIFNHVRRIVNLFLGKTRPGIMLGLVELGFDRGNFIGGLHYSGTNEIYLNKSALRVLKQETTPDKYKAYLYFLLLHEYIHSVGYHNESQTRLLTKKIIMELFPQDHVLVQLAIYGLNYFFPYSFNQDRYTPSQKELLNPDFVTIRHFENEYTYV